MIGNHWRRCDTPELLLPFWPKGTHRDGKQHMAWSFFLLKYDFISERHILFMTIFYLWSYCFSHAGMLSSQGCLWKGKKNITSLANKEQQPIITSRVTTHSIIDRCSKEEIQKVQAVKRWYVALQITWSTIFIHNFRKKDHNMIYI